MKPQNELVVENRGIQVRIEYRHAVGDEGVTFHVYGKEKEKKVEVLRFDCFEKNPHDHYDPSGKNEQHLLDKKKIHDPLAWVMTQLKSQLSTMVEHAGYRDIARAIDQKATAEALAKLEKEIGRLKTPA